MVEKVEFTEFGIVAERICGICSFMHGMGYCLALEELMKVEIPERARWLRLVWAELSRIQSHLLWLGLGADALRASRTCSCSAGEFARADPRHLRAHHRRPDHLTRSTASAG